MVSPGAARRSRCLLGEVEEGNARLEGGRRVLCDSSQQLQRRCYTNNNPHPPQYFHVDDADEYKCLDLFEMQINTIHPEQIYLNVMLV